jgi:hypothetical protein
MPRGRPKKDVEAAPKPKLNKHSYYVRDEHGLLKNVDYEWNDDGSINWRAMIKDEHLFPNKSWFEGRGKEIPSSAEGLSDHQLLIKLGGIKELAKLRGFKSVKYTSNVCREDHVAVTCEIEFLPNYETSGEAVVFQDMANATLNNTSSFATKFLEAIACNRAFIRCVRNFLNVHIVGDDEIDKSNKPAVSALSPLNPNSLLENEFTDFELFKDKMRELWSAGAYQNKSVAEWKSFSDIPPKEARILIKLVK